MNNYIKLFSMLLVSFLVLTIVLGTVSATKVGTSDNIELKDTVSSNINTFTDLNKEISQKNYIELNQDINVTSDDIKSTGKDGLSITKNTTINGNGHFINANHLIRIFDVKPNSALTLINLTLKNGGDYNLHGGAINTDTNCFLSLINCTFTGNVGNSAGGTIYNCGYMTLINCTFRDNHASTTGGAISNSGTLSIYGCKFINNTAKGDKSTHCEGGAIFSDHDLICMDSYFDNNIAEDGGAIYCEANLVVNNSIFINNAAKDAFLDCEGGAIWCKPSLKINNCIFFNNVAKDSTNEGEGGAIFCDDLNECRNCTFIDNRADNYGGAILIHGKCGINLIEDCIFEDNKASNGKGGAIFVDHRKAHISLVHNQWIGNWAEEGDKVYNEGYYNKIEYNYFSNSKETSFIEDKFIKNKNHYDNHPFYDLTSYYNHIEINCVDRVISNENSFVVKVNGIKSNNLLSVVKKSVNSNSNQYKISSNDYVNKNSANKVDSSAKSSIDYVNKNSANKVDSGAKSTKENTVATFVKTLTIQDQIMSKVSNVISNQMISKVSQGIINIQNTLKNQQQYLIKSCFGFVDALNNIIS